jgi:molybdopterin synthase catalytic subunit
MITLQVLAFGILKEQFGQPGFSIEMANGSTVADLLIQLNSQLAAPIPSGIAIGVNAEFAQGSQVLRDGDEIALLPPVSGGCPEPDGDPETIVFLTRTPIDSTALIAQGRRGDDGAIVVFDGVVRNQTRGRQVLYLDYETYEPMALRQLRSLAHSAKEMFAVRHVTIVHRLERMYVGESSILIVVSSAHRAQAFDACRWLIDTIKKQVPIWKNETFADGACWADGEPFPDDISVKL